MMDTYVVVTTAEDGTLGVWGPFRSWNKAVYVMQEHLSDLDPAIYTVYSPKDL